MTRREAKRVACTLAANLLSADLQQDSWLLERISSFADDERDRIVSAVWELVIELTRRGPKARGN
jgi:hypothetical protein